MKHIKQWRVVYNNKGWVSEAAGNYTDYQEALKEAKRWNDTELHKPKNKRIKYKVEQCFHSLRIS